MANPGERIMRASCNEDSVVVELADGSRIDVGATDRDAAAAIILRDCWRRVWHSLAGDRRGSQRRRPASGSPSATRFRQGQLTRRWIRRRLASSGVAESVVRR